MNSDFKWIYFVSRRISRVDRKGRTAATSMLASFGVCLGVMALIVVMSVMNGFQMGFIDSIMEISSYHVQVSDIDEKAFEHWCAADKNVICSVPFYEAQGLMVSGSGKQCAAIIRAVPENTMDIDSRFKKELKIIAGKFDLSSPDSIVIGNTLAYNLNLRIGSAVNIAALSGSSDTRFLSSNRQFVVKGIFYCGYSEINSSYSFININAGERYLGNSAEKKYGIKLNSSSGDASFIRKFFSSFKNSKAVSWREYNRSFFGVLRMEKNMIFVIVLLIFVVVGINIFSSMKRLVFERKEEIAVLSALGASPKNVQCVFIVQGACTGLLGAVPGLILGVLISDNMKTVFIVLSKIQFGIEYFFTFVFRHGHEYLVTENPMFAVYAGIPARIFIHEVVLIFIFGVFSALGASWLASRDILKMTVSEVLRDE